MKKIILLAAIIVASFANAKADHAPVTVVSTADAFMYIKVSKSMIGGVLEIRDERDSLIETINVEHHKMYVDFFYKDAGKYKVSVKKDDITIQFGYTLCEPKSVSADNTDCKNAKG